MIKIIDYGVGNIKAFLSSYKRLGIEIEKASSVEELNDATHIILPGVGSFDHAMSCFNKSGLREKVEELVVRRKVPILGICVGMQMLADFSEEGCLSGLGWIPGRVVNFNKVENAEKLPLPHMGWNDIDVKYDDKHLFDSLSDINKFYFLHSYFFVPSDDSHIVATANYGFEFACVINKDNVFGIQCHPEKSHNFGSNLLKRFAEI